MYLAVGRGETLGLVGETGAGKTTLALSLLGLLPKGIGEVTSGAVEFEGTDLFGLKEGDLRVYRGRLISMIFQDPMTSLNPVIPVGKQVAEILELHNDQHLTREQIDGRVDKMFRLVGIPPERKHEYPHQFSGGRRAHHRPGRDHSGPGAGHDVGAEGEAGNLHDYDHPRPGHCGGDL